MRYVILNTDTGKFVKASSRITINNGSSYTSLLQDAATYHSRESALRARCPGNEILLSLEDLLAPAEDE